MAADGFCLPKCLGVQRDSVSSDVFCNFWRLWRAISPVCERLEAVFLEETGCLNIHVLLTNL